MRQPGDNGGGQHRENKLTVVCGAQWVWKQNTAESMQKIRDRAVGDIVSMESRYLAGPVLEVNARDPKWGDMEWEHREWYSFVWICGDMIVEQHIHGINYCNWIIGAHPERVVASGGVAWSPSEEKYGNIYGHMNCTFVYPNGVPMYTHTRHYPPGTGRPYGEDFFTGTKGKHSGKGVDRPDANDYVTEHFNLVASIRGDLPYLNQGMQVAESTMTTTMGREAAYSGLEITWDMIMNSKQDLQPMELDYKVKMVPPPVPVPGQYKFV